MSLAGKMEEQSLMKHDTQAAALCTSRSTPALLAATLLPRLGSVRFLSHSHNHSRPFRFLSLSLFVTNSAKLKV